MSTSIVPLKIASAVLSVGVQTEGWNLAEVPADSFETPRVFTTPIAFVEPFQGIPVVQAALSGFDLDQRDSARVSLGLSQITPEGFTLEITTWRETRVYAVEVSWLAIGS
jgi:hypothetical protein